MSSRSDILNAIIRNKPSGDVLPEFNLHFSPDENLFLGYLIALDKCGGRFIFMDSAEELSNFIIAEFPQAKSICSLIPEVQGDVDIEKVYDPHWLNSVDIAIIKGAMGVAENAAIWLSERTIVHRVLPFITQHLIILLDKDTIVANMHEAYSRIDIDDDGFGVFVAGPSKTADIEQSLVIGAHGPRTLDVIFIGK